ncbi:hypothetical protein D4764_05G0001890 [Takifugu flavidus]|uniref:SMB domain-containing protein n=1 Tax=Takifugu flavidus TaxID=433684 RepID=A0A5C6MZF6_9TELE|nr:hypothetical protein D4764_05G0001890 [Takifugu flavidus]
MGAHGWSSVHVGLMVCGYVAFFCGELFPGAEAGCRERENPNCCTGRNNDCFEYTRSKTVCYCDTYCQKTGDCCEDYQRVCQVSEAASIRQPGAILHHSIHPVRLPNRTIMGKHLRGGPEQAHGPASGVTGWTGNISQNPSQTAHWTALDHIRDSVTLCNLGISKSSE